MSEVPTEEVEKLARENVREILQTLRTLTTADVPDATIIEHLRSVFGACDPEALISFTVVLMGELMLWMQPRQVLTRDLSTSRPIRVDSPPAPAAPAAPDWVKEVLATASDKDA